MLMQLRIFDNYPLMNKKILKISQLQIQGSEEPVKNSELIKENL